MQTKTRAEIIEGMTETYAALYRFTDRDSFDSGYLSGLQSAAIAFGFEADEIRDMREAGKTRAAESK